MSPIHRNRFLKMRFIFCLSLVLIGTGFSCQAQSIAIELDKDYSKTSVLHVNGFALPQRDAHKTLSERIRRSDDAKNTPVVVIMSDLCRFEDWLNVQILLNKVGFVNVRYFVASKETKYMSELELHSAVPISANPKKSDSK